LLADGTYGVYTTKPPLITGLLYGNPGFLACQLISIVVNFSWAFGTGFLLFYALEKDVGLRVSPEEELFGLDIGEHGVVAYPDFVYAETARPLIVRRVTTEEADEASGEEVSVMKKIEAIIGPEKVDDVKSALEQAGFVSMNVSEYGDEGGRGA